MSLARLQRRVVNRDFSQAPAPGFSADSARRQLVHYLPGEVAGVEVGHEAPDLVAFDLQDAHAVVGDGVAVRGARGRPLERRPLLGGDDVAELGFHLAEGTAVIRPELAQAFVAVEGPRDRDVAYLAVFGVHFDQRLDVLVLFQLPQRRYEVVRHLSGHITGPFSDDLPSTAPWSAETPRLPELLGHPSCFVVSPTGFRLLEACLVSMRSRLLSATQNLVATPLPRRLSRMPPVGHSCSLVSPRSR